MMTGDCIHILGTVLLAAALLPGAAQALPAQSPPEAVGAVSAWPAEELGEDQKDSNKEEDSNPARENDELREFFLAQYYDLSRIEIRYLRRNPPIPGRRHSKFKPDRFVNHFIDKRIDLFVKNLEETITEGEAALAEVRALSELVGSDFSQFNKVRGRWRGAFDRVAKKSDDLHDRVAMVFLPLDGDVDLKLETGREDLRDGYLEQVEALESNFRIGVQRVRDLVVKPNHTVHISDLQNNESVLTYLRRAKLLSEHLRAQLKR